jgi:hypothetical protein
LKINTFTTLAIPKLVGGAAADEKKPSEEDEDEDQVNWTALYHCRFNWIADDDCKICYLVPKRASSKAILSPST